MAKSNFIVSRRGSASLYYRRRYPKDVAAKLRQEAFCKSLGTGDRTEARRRLGDIEALYWAQVRQARAAEPDGIFSRSPIVRWEFTENTPELTDEAARFLAQSYFRRRLLALDREPPMEHQQRQIEYLDELKDRYERLRRPLETDEIDETVGIQVGLIKEAGARTDYMSEPAKLLRQFVRRVLVQLVAIEIARARGDFSDTITDSLFKGTGGPVDADTPLPARPSVSNTLLLPEIVDRWASEREVSPKGIDKHRAAARWFIDRGGPTIVETITRKDVLAFKDRLISEGTTAANANAKLSCLRTLLGYAVDNAVLDANPAYRVHVLDKDKDRRRRQEFDLPSLQTIFSSPVYSEDARPRRGRGEAAYWLPVIALFTGARLEEMAQLRPTDISNEPYTDAADVERNTWVIRFTEDDEDMSLKNATSERRVPVHQELERLGLVRFAQQASDSGQALLFPGLRRNIYGKLSPKWGEWWSTYLRGVCGITDRRLVFHSFRHTYKYFSRHVGMIEGVQRQLLGHSPGDTAAEYSPRRYSLHQLVEGTALYRIPGLKLLPPPAFR